MTSKKKTYFRKDKRSMPSVDENMTTADYLRIYFKRNPYFHPVTYKVGENEVIA